MYRANTSKLYRNPLFHRPFSLTATGEPHYSDPYGKVMLLLFPGKSAASVRVFPTTSPQTLFRYMQTPTPLAIVTLLASLFWAMVSAPFAGAENLTYRLTQSTQHYTLWTAPPADKIFPLTAIPQQEGSQLYLAAAANELCGGDAVTEVVTRVRDRR